jgi:hypothetical protein
MYTRAKLSYIKFWSDLSFMYEQEVMITLEKFNDYLLSLFNELTINNKT